MEVWQWPASAFVARFLGFDNIAEATVSGAVAVTEWGKLPVPDGTEEGARQVLVRPTGVRLGPPDEGLTCEVVARTFRGGHVAVLLRPERGPVLEAECALREAPAEGVRVGVAFAAEDVVVLDR
jgi:thiamine transport system ATP-binding protein